MEGGEAAMVVSEGIERTESRNAKPLRAQSTRSKASAPRREHQINASRHSSHNRGTFAYHFSLAFMPRFFII